MYHSTLSLTGERVLSFLLRHLGKEYSIREIANGINQDYKIVFTTVRHLEDEKLLTIHRVSNINRCSATLAKINAPVFAYISERFTQTTLPKRIATALQEVVQSIKNPCYTMLVFGSYAKRSAKPISDVDILVIIPEKSYESEILAAIKKSAALNNLTLNPILLTQKEFLAGLQERSVSAEAYENHLVIYGGEMFYSLISP